MLVVEGWKGNLLLLAAWAIIASLVSLYLGYRRYIQQDEEREKRCHHTLDVDQRIILIEAFNAQMQRAEKSKRLRSVGNLIGKNPFRWAR